MVFEIWRFEALEPNAVSNLTFLVAEHDKLDFSARPKWWR